MDAAADAAPPTPPPTTAATPAPPSAAPSPGELWPLVLERARPRLRAMLESVSVQHASEKLLKLGVPAGRSAMARDHLPDIARIVQDIGARSVSIQLVELREADTRIAEQPTNGHGGHTPAAAQTDTRTNPRPPPPAAEPSSAEADPLVQRAAEVFGAKVVHVHPKRR